jgi:peptidyl-dipeptidase Dcp
MKDLSGLPEGTIEAARSLAKSQERNGMDFTLDYKLCSLCYLCWQPWTQETNGYRFGAKGFQNNEFDNQEMYLKL